MWTDFPYYVPDEVLCFACLEQNTEAEPLATGATGNSNNCCNVQQPKVAMTYDHRPVPSAPATSLGSETSLEIVRPRPGPLINTQVASRETGLNSYRVSSSSGVPLRIKTEEPVAGSGARGVPTAMPDYYRPQYADRFSQFFPQQHSVGVGALNRIEAGNNPISNPVSQWIEQQKSPLNFQHVAPSPAQLPNRLPSQSLAAPPLSSRHFDQCDLNSGMLAQGSKNLGTVPAPSGASGSRLLNRDYVETYNQADSHLSDSWQVSHVPQYDAQTTSPSDFNSMEWNIIDKDSFLSSPKTSFSNVASGLTNSSSTSSLYDNLSDFGIVGIDGRVIHPDADSLKSISNSSISNSSLPLDVSLTESYYIVPSAESFDRFSKSYLTLCIVK